MPKDASKRPRLRPGLTSYFCRCKGFGCGNIPNNTNPANRPFGRYLGSISELREHARLDRRSLRRAESDNAIAGPSQNVNTDDGSTIILTNAEEDFGATSLIAQASNSSTSTLDSKIIDSNSSKQSADKAPTLPPNNGHGYLPVSGTSAAPHANNEDVETSDIKNLLKYHSVSAVLNNWKVTFEYYIRSDMTFPDWRYRPRTNLNESRDDAADMQAIQELEQIYQQLNNIYQRLSKKLPFNDREIAVQLAPVYGYERMLENLAAKVKEVDTGHIIQLGARKRDIVSAIQNELNRVRQTHGDYDDSETFIDTSRYAASKFVEFDAVTLGCLILPAILHLVCGVSLDRCSFALQAFKSILAASFSWHSRVAGEYRNIIDSIPNGIGPVIDVLDLRPITKKFVCCPKCYKCYQISICPQNCTGRKFKSRESAACGEVLLKLSVSKNNPEPIPIAIQEFIYHDFKEWIGELLWRPGVEDLLFKDHFADNVNSNERMNDIWDGDVLKTFVGPDNQPFFQNHGSEGHLAFSLSMDGFNPFQNKQAGKKVEVGSIYLLCDSLPPGIRYDPKNIFLVAIIPGPKKPSLDDMNHLLRPLIDDLLVFWRTGVYYSKTPAFPEGRLIRCALVLIVCDLPAARQISGFASHSSNNFCSFCHLTLDTLDDIFPKGERSNKEHRKYVNVWLNAQSVKDREEIFKKHGVRYSELLRLPYADLPRITVLDPMHSLFLGNLHRHCRIVLGMDAKLEDGNGEENVSSQAKADPKLVQKALVTLKHGSLSELENYTVSVLSQVAKLQNLRFAGSKKFPLIKVLRQYRIEQGWFDANEQKLQSDNDPEIINDSKDINASKNSMSLEEYKAAKEYIEIARSTDDLASLRKPILVCMCMETLGLNDTKNGKSIFERETRENLAARLTEWRIKNSFADASGNAIRTDLERSLFLVQKLQRKKTAVLGVERLKEVWDDMKSTILPTWISPAPHRIGDGKHGKINADQWRSFCTVHLVITLIRIWGSSPEGTRQHKMLENFMHLITAVKAATMRTMTNDRIQLFTDNMTLYLRGVIILFPGIELSPNQHLSLHLARSLKDFGPTHSWRTFASERYNFSLQQINTNRKFGDIEKTMIDRFCSVQRLRHIMRTEHLPTELKDLITSFENTFCSDVRGTLLNDITAFQSVHNIDLQSPRAKELKFVKMSDEHVNLLDQYSRSNGGDPRRVIRPYAAFVTSFDVGGISYTTTKHSKSQCNSNIVVGKVPGDWYACSIETIFIHAKDAREPEVTATYFIVHKYKELTAEDSKHDHYRRFTVAGGRLFYDEFERDVQLIKASDALCHFALTPYRHDGELLKGQCIHALPLDRVRTFHRSVFRRQAETNT